MFACGKYHFGWCSERFGSRRAMFDPFVSLWTSAWRVPPFVKQTEAHRTLRTMIIINQSVLIVRPYNQTASLLRTLRTPMTIWWCALLARTFSECVSCSTVANSLDAAAPKRRSVSDWLMDKWAHVCIERARASAYGVCYVPRSRRRTCERVYTRTNTCNRGVRVFCAWSIMECKERVCSVMIIFYSWIA